MRSASFSKPKQTVGESTVDDAFGYWFSGITDGEGMFTYLHKSTDQRYYPVFRILLRRDDREVLEFIGRKVKLGRLFNQRAYINKKSPYQSKPTSYFQVGKVKECLQIVKIFEKYPLHSKKRRDFEIWKQMVSSIQLRGQSNNPLVEQLARRLTEIKAYDDKITDTCDTKIETRKVSGTQNPQQSLFD